METDMVRPDFEALKNLLDMANNLLHSHTINQTIGQDKWVHEISEASLRILSSCGNIKDVLLLLKDHLHSLQSTFRRVTISNNNTTTTTTTIAGIKFSCYSLQRKELKKVMLQRLGSLKGMKNPCITSDVSALNQNLILVINVLRQVRKTTMSIIETLLSLMSLPSPNPNKSKSSRGFFKAKLTRVDSLSSWENCCVEAAILQAAGERLQAAEISIRGLEEELECIFRRLIQTRVSLLNMLNNQN